MRSDLVAEVEERGFALARGVLSHAEVEWLITDLETAEPTPFVRCRKARVYAVRQLLEAVPAVRQLAEEGPLPQLARQVLGADARPAKATLFDKVETANWKVPWHQDRSVYSIARFALGLPLGALTISKPGFTTNFKRRLHMAGEVWDP